MTDTRDAVQQKQEHQATLLETQLDSIALMLGQMKAKVRKNQLLDHITSAERAELEAALTRTNGRLSELLEAVRTTGNA